jgi:hypothetical protein
MTPAGLHLHLALVMAAELGVVCPNSKQCTQELSFGKW